MSCYVPLGVGFTETIGKILGLHEYLCDLIAQGCRDGFKSFFYAYVCCGGKCGSVVKEEFGYESDDIFSDDK